MARRKKNKYRCSDRMCGALDCDTCYPGNHYGEVCASCDQEYDDCECEEFDSSGGDDDDYDDRDDYMSREEEDYWSDRAADAYEERLFRGK
jgi:hypothetical protein